MQINVIHRSRFIYVVLCVTLGWSGAHHFYLKRNLFGVIYLLSFGLFGIGWLYDLFRINSLLLDYELNFRGQALLRHDDMKLLTWCLGFTGLQHFILKRYACGFYFLFTFGGLGVGWLMDLFRIHLLTESYNLKGYQRMSRITDHQLTDAYIYCLPFGFLGLHHFYLSRPKWGIFYLMTLGNFGVGWITDIFRLKGLVQNSNERPKWSLIDAFVLWFPLGFFGAHWWYLNQRPRAIAYAFTLGYLGIGWLIDIRRIPVHVRSLNRKCMLAGIIHAEDAESLQWDDSDFSSVLLPNDGGGLLKVSKNKVHLSRMTSRTVCLECSAPGVCVMPCTHFSLCVDCVQSSEHCPRCITPINGWATVDI
ncbi:uncharacterized protein LOC134811246 [Bolinopsis microptera]|uniref:uncharacterized protein LOC134811246 n=1 Tax=Bolinopsis microptera TaxID=2820187 RepID=UPI00307A0B14